MFSNRKPSTSQQPEHSIAEPQSIGEVIDKIFDVDERKINVDPVAELARKREVVERLAAIVETVKEDRNAEIERAKAGEDRDPEDMKVLGEQLIELTAKREELDQQVQELSDRQPPEQP